MAIKSGWTLLSAADRELVAAAQRVSANSYAPYSRFAVGAAVRTKSGNIHSGANLENASYGLTMCAEVGAITAANSAGDFDIAAIAVVGGAFDDAVGNPAICTPCGRCRQLIFEASQISAVDIQVLSCSSDLETILTRPISALLPHAFGPENLGVHSTWETIRAALRSKIKRLAERTSLS